MIGGSVREVGLGINVGRGRGLVRSVVGVVRSKWLERGACVGREVEGVDWWVGEELRQVRCMNDE